MKLLVTITHSAHVADRRALLVGLKRSLGAFPEFVVKTYLNRGLRRETTAQASFRGWQWGYIHQAKASHLLTLQDDTEVCRDFWQHLSAVATAHPNRVVSLFANSKAVESAWAAKKPYCEGPGAVWGQGILIPTALLHSLMEFIRKDVRPGYPHDDRLIAGWLTKSGRDPIVTVPSLVEHTGHGKSASGHNPPQPNVARVFLKDFQYVYGYWSAQVAMDPINCSQPDLKKGKMLR